MKILIHLTQGAENPTVAALAFLMSRTALEEKHQVNLFLAGDAVSLMRDAILDNVSGIGTGKLREHYDEAVKGGVRVYLSGMSSKARGMTEADVLGKPIEFAPPSMLLRLAIESDKMFVY
jgi:predicted peroxiredoxin